MKVSARRKARLLNIEAVGTGGGPKREKALTDMEERLLALLSKVVITGLPGIEEVGFTTEQPENNFQEV